MTERRPVEITLVEQDVHSHGPVPFGSVWDQGSLKQLIDALRAIHKAIPKEFRKTAHAEIASRSAPDGSHHATITIGYRRPENDEELAVRRAAERQSAAEEEAQALRQYEALKRRFGPGKRRKDR